ncbi:MAG: efflux RND transporter periplasmic adaptor subunit [Planctomycetota bacterium]|nr:efflux RND transporter periplasmic adaptor subunit [Planctomycetota bacterium]MDA1114494.1 efflux RND transporter periplasmic adaptor subunit [Planctomycetota bacterium]
MRSCTGLLPILLGLALSACSKEASYGVDGEASEEGGGYTFPVTFVEMQGGLVEEVSEFSGDVASKRHVYLAFERAGRIVDQPAQEGETVEKGQLLARLDNSVLDAELLAARAMEEVARVEREYAEKELKRFEGMGAAASDADRDSWKFEISLRTATEVQRAAETYRLEKQMEQGSLFAPFSGILVKRDLALGSYATQGATVFELVDLAHREIRLELPQAMAVSLELGIDVLIRSQALASGTLTAKLTAILPSTQSATRTFTGLIDLGPELDQEQQLLPGAYVLVQLETRSAEVESVVPADALVRTGEDWAVVVADEGTPPTARFVPIHILAHDGRRVAVVALEPGSLQPGVKIVVTGTDNVFPFAPLLLQAHQDPSATGLSLPSPSDS